MIGDDPFADIGGGRGAGVRTVWMRRGRVWAEDSFAPDREADGSAEAIMGVVAPPS
jgi:FMN phosphatase YigB (HAD superfamily)